MTKLSKLSKTFVYLQGHWGAGQSFGPRERAVGQEGRTASGGTDSAEEPLQHSGGPSGPHAQGAVKEDGEFPSTAQCHRTDVTQSHTMIGKSWSQMANSEGLLCTIWCQSIYSLHTVTWDGCQNFWYKWQISFQPQRPWLHKTFVLLANKPTVVRTVRVVISR